MKVYLKKEPFLKTIARKNISQNEFAKSIGLSSTYMSQILTHVRNPSAIIRRKIMKKLHLGNEFFDLLFEIKQ